MFGVYLGGLGCLLLGGWWRRDLFVCGCAWGGCSPPEVGVHGRKVSDEVGWEPSEPPGQPYSFPDSPQGSLEQASPGTSVLRGLLMGTGT